ncbi:unnamed protein product [Ceutorhynchus assimilis]|uniref:DNA meiotic recombinase 1 n=1 Tax=Ceutorhynchus assimilis TaxID=467358 RepID=A0A9N9QIF2_9CUCU|nr:unnamed protein product [Ceutorhynchus assimilis]
MAQMQAKPERLPLPIEVEEAKSDKSDSGMENESVGEYEEDGFFDVDSLLEHNIPVEDIKQLKKVGINTIKGLQMCTSRSLATLKGFTPATVEKIKHACAIITNATTENCFMTGLEVSAQRRHIFQLTTGSKNINAILGGGIESMAITEVFGESRSGKTQLAHTLCVTAQLPNEAQEYQGGKVMFIDTESTFRPDRIKPIADRFELDSSGVLENILCARAYNSEQLYELLTSAGNVFHKDPGMFKLLIIDSIMAPFRVDFIGAGEMSERQTKLGLMLSKLQKMSEEYNIAVFLTNQITTDMSQPLTLLNNAEVKPIGGNVLAHATTTRMVLKRGQFQERIAKIYGSPNLEEQETKFDITLGGITDPKPQDE